MKSAKDFLQEANAVVPRLSAEEAIAKYNAGGCVFVDVRDSGAIAKSGTIKDAHRIARGIFAGVLVTFTPFYGLHFVLAALITRMIGGKLTLPSTRRVNPRATASTASLFIPTHLRISFSFKIITFMDLPLRFSAATRSPGLSGASMPKSS